MKIYSPSLRSPPPTKNAITARSTGLEEVEGFPGVPRTPAVCGPQMPSPYLSLASRTNEWSCSLTPVNRLDDDPGQGTPSVTADSGTSGSVALAHSERPNCCLLEWIDSMLHLHKVTQCAFRYVPLDLLAVMIYCEIVTCGRKDGNF